MIEEQFRKYFLGNLTQTEAERFEEEVALSEEQTELAGIVQRDLIDEYVCGELSPADAKLFEKNYLTNDRRIEKVKISRALWKAARENTVVRNRPAKRISSDPEFLQVLAVCGGMCAALSGFIGVMCGNFEAARC